jgi:hypothetical protein
MNIIKVINEYMDTYIGILMVRVATREYIYSIYIYIHNILYYVMYLIEHNLTTVCRCENKETSNPTVIVFFLPRKIP